MAKVKVQSVLLKIALFFCRKKQGDTITGLEGIIKTNANKIVTDKEGRNDNPYVCISF